MLRLLASLALFAESAAYTHNFGYVGSRTTGNGGGTFLLAGPDWKGTVPPGIDRVFRSETRFAFVFYRTQL